MGGQVPNNLALRCHEAGMRILGTSPRSHRPRREPRTASRVCSTSSGSTSPPWRELTSVEDSPAVRRRARLPGARAAVIRAVRGGDGGRRKRRGAQRPSSTRRSKISPDHPVVVSKFIENAKEIDVDAVARDGELVCWAVSEHVENAGVHSGDATLVLPPQRTYLETMRRIRGHHDTGGGVAEHHRAVQHPVPRQGQRRHGDRVQPARLAVVSVRLQGAASATSSTSPPG